MCYEPLQCPKCHTPEPLRRRREGRRRQYTCLKCGFWFTTREEIEATIERQAFQAWLDGFLEISEDNRTKAKTIAHDMLKGK